MIGTSPSSRPQISGFQETLTHFLEKKEGVEEEEASLHQENSQAERRMLALLTVFNSWAFLETRRLVQVFPEHVRKLWNNWELRVLVLVSLTLQLCLLHFGSRRRYSVKTWLRVFLWLS
ncbi:uncharacterized protein LOC126727453 [Quercus robur]|uniref:uncharacterized protein LOC126727453 n=1 Tax=Quercus robur TaxID=38942 RepID=UPI00216366C7|nr:uncharacterized protein LOC126727453 [Quercus robur]